MWQWIGDNIPKAIDKLTEWVKSMGTWVATGDGNASPGHVWHNGNNDADGAGQNRPSARRISVGGCAKLIKSLWTICQMMITKARGMGTALWNWIQGNWPTWKSQVAGMGQCALAMDCRGNANGLSEA